MRRSLLFSVVCMGMMSVGLAVTDAWAVGPPAKVIPSRQAIFDIPFKINTDPRSPDAPVEVQLLVSGNQGKTWDLYSRVKPDEGRFPFNASRDGEYWFQIRTVNKANQIQTMGSGPGLRVVVDTTAPRLSLDADQGPGGQITAVWRIEEPNLVRDTVVLQYRAGESDPWKIVTLGPRNHEGGFVSWIARDDRGAALTDTDIALQIEVRMEVADVAGNKSITLARVGRNGVLATGGTQPAGTPTLRIGEPSSLTATALGARRLPAVDPSPGPNESAPGLRVEMTPQSRTTMAPAALRTAVPTGERMRMVNSRVFPLSYDIMPVGPSGIQRVELFSTRDGGLSWQSHQLDDDRRSPINVHVKEEGTYGFRMVVHNGAGIGGEPPRSGDLPEVTVGVDLSEPQVQLLSVEKGTGIDSDRLVISWKATDRMLAAGPISIQYGTSAYGPSVPLVCGLENTGRYAWPINRRLSGTVYFRVQAQDEAGNVGASKTAIGYSLDDAGSSLKIRTPDEKKPKETAGRPYGRSSY